MIRAACIDKAARGILSRRRSDVQAGTARHTSAEQDGVVTSYDIDPGDTIEAVVCALLLVPLSVACVVLIGVVRACGAK